MAARRKRRWLAIGGTTAAVAAVAWAGVALGTPINFVAAPAITKVAPHLTWGDDNAANTGYTVQRHKGDCTGLTDLAPSATSPFDDTSLQPGGADDGTYCYQVVGHYTPDPDAPSANQVSVLYDTKPPALQIMSPANGSVVRGAVPVSAMAPADGGSAPVSVTISIDGAVFASGVASAGATWTPVADGQHTVTATAVDTAGNTATASSTVTVDNTPPGAPVFQFLQNPVAGSPTLVWAPVAGETYHVTRTSPVAKAFTLPVTPNWTDPDVLAPGTYAYTVTATDPVGNSTTAAEKSVVVISPSVTAPRALSAVSPTNTVPHLSWQPPVTFAVTSWRILRDGSLLTTVSDPAATTFDDAGLTVQGTHAYQVQAVSGGIVGDISSSVSVTFDTIAPGLLSATATALPSGAISVIWPDATDPPPGSGLSKYVVRRGASPPPDMSSGTAVCTLQAPDNGCTDTTTKTGTTYGYAVFAVDAAGNVARREASAKASDTLAPDPVTGLKIVSSGATYVRLTWNPPADKGGPLDIAGYRVIQLRKGAKTPLSPTDGTVVCRGVDLAAPLCDVLNLTKGKKVTFAVYAFDDVPNYSTPALLSTIPHKIDNTPPHKPTKVKLVHNGLRYLMTWVSPRDADLSKFRVTLYDKKPPTRPSLGKAVVTGRVLGTTFKLAPGRKVYVTLFALDLSGNFSKVTRHVVAPGSIVAKSKHRAKQKAGSKKTVAPKKTAASKTTLAPKTTVAPKTTAPPQKKTVKEKPIPVAIS